MVLLHFLADQGIQALPAILSPLAPPLYSLMNTLDLVPPLPGTYVLATLVGRDRTIRVGALGPLRLRPGTYLYVGSALGPGGLRGRLRHHLRVSERPRWHLDFLRRHAHPTRVWLVTGSTRLECRWAEALGASSVLERFGVRFGSSDCRCPSHLFFAGLPAGELHEIVSRQLGRRIMNIRL